MVSSTMHCDPIEPTESSPVSDVIWVEKYRPKTVGGIVHQDHVKRMLLEVEKTGNMPHCLFFGPPGTGKTSAALALCHDLFGNHNFKRRVLELNASDDRGISVIREKIKGWARILVGTSSISDNTQLIADWKVVILDEADMMTPDAQSALRRIMEDNARTTRFIIICNYVSRIIDPIASRCARLRFDAIEHSVQYERLNAVAHAEHLPVDSEAVDRLCDISAGDLRMAIMLLQSASTLIDADSRLTVEHIEAVAGIPPSHVSEAVFDTCIHEKPNVSYVELQEDITAAGWDVSQLLRQILRLVIKSNDLNDDTKASIVTVITTAHFRLTQGACESLQLLEVLMALGRESGTC